MMTAYKEMGFNIIDYPQAYNHYQNQITLPLYSKLSELDIDYIISNFKESLKECECC